MKAYALTDAGPQLIERAEPRARAGEVLIRVKAAALNRADLGLAAGMKHGASGGVGQVLGSDWAGEVAALGEGVHDLVPGQRVMGPGWGSLAEFKVAPRAQVLPMPAGLSFETAAGASVALMTMHDALITQGHLQPGQSVLIQGATSGVGLIGMQIAKLKGAGVVIGSSTRAERLACLSDYGADLAIDSSDPQWVVQVLEATGGKGVDLIVDQVAGRLMNQNFAATRILGRIVNVGRLGGRRGEIDFDLHALRRITYIGVTFRTRTPAEAAEALRLMREDLWDDLGAGRIVVPIAERFPLARAADAFALMKSNAHLGKIIVEP